MECEHFCPYCIPKEGVNEKNIKEINHFFFNSTSPKLSTIRVYAGVVLHCSCKVLLKGAFVGIGWSMHSTSAFSKIKCIVLLCKFKSCQIDNLFSSIQNN